MSNRQSMKYTSDAFRILRGKRLLKRASDSEFVRCTLQFVRECQMTQFELKYFNKKLFFPVLLEIGGANCGVGEGVMIYSRGNWKVEDRARAGSCLEARAPCIAVEMEALRHSKSLGTSSALKLPDDCLSPSSVIFFVESSSIHIQSAIVPFFASRYRHFKAFAKWAFYEK
ncbi:hypothetical protein TNCV_4363801 [Trichonephila clavipes]|nr:hypothetical protein TNCV_4363801 [Trichonephila clavipes]